MRTYYVNKSELKKSDRQTNIKQYSVKANIILQNIEKNAVIRH